MEKKSFGESLDAFFSGKGFYIVLFLCAAVIGVSAWVLATGNRADVEDAEVSVMADQPPQEPAHREEKPETAEPSVGSVVIPEAELAETPEETDLQQQEVEPVMVLTQEPEPAVSPEKLYVWPVGGEIEVPYSVTALLYDGTMKDWRTHDGVDICAELGTQVLAMASGVVERVYTDDLYGVTVVIDHNNGVKSSYSNLAGTPTVYEGDGVTVGEVIGAVGDTALVETGEVTHLHLSVTCDGQSADPLDYLP